MSAIPKFFVLRASARIKDVTVSYRPDWTSTQGGMKKFKARVLGFDRTNDLALLQIQAPGPFAAAEPLNGGNSS